MPMGQAHPAFSGPRQCLGGKNKLPLSLQGSGVRHSYGLQVGVTDPQIHMLKPSPQCSGTEGRGLKGMIKVLIKEAPGEAV